jgi:hypothetical protein
VPGEQGAYVGQGDLTAGREVATGQRHLEVELAQPVGQPDLAQRHPSGERTERGVVQRDEGAGELVGRGVDRPPHALLLDLAAQLGLEVGRQGVGQLENTVHEGAERSARRQRRHR